ncbi:hypothetical protein [Amycolatopsis magusensis]|nr:hypothetical protein [Amycolatopsis magusensis]MDI5982272.1 hypothetical protein [Amycolatopsis magusensis]
MPLCLFTGTYVAPGSTVAAMAGRSSSSTGPFTETDHDILAYH